MKLSKKGTYIPETKTTKTIVTTKKYAERENTMLQLHCETTEPL